MDLLTSESLFPLQIRLQQSGCSAGKCGHLRHASRQLSLRAIQPLQGLRAGARCRYGYPSLDVAEAVVANYSAAGIPLETMWLDIDYMHGFRDYTFDPVNFPAARVEVRG